MSVPAFPLFHCIRQILLGLAALMALPVLASAPALIPAPAALEIKEGHFRLDAGASVFVDGEDAGRAADYLQSMLEQSHRMALNRADDEGAAITLRVERTGFSADASAESYRLEITPARVRIEAPDARGLLYGAVTLWQLASVSGDDKAALILPALYIEDAPRFGWRGYMLDSARDFQSVAQIEQILDAMVLHKLNLFHWHLTDDQGWRIEIKAYPQLTRTGGCRIPPQTPSAPPQCGWYTQEDIRHLVRYAAARNITIVPEIDVPGHATAAIASYPELGAAQQQLAVSTARGVHPNLFNLEESTFAFLDTVLGEVAGLFPGEYVHIGGDEALKGQWQASNQVQARMRELDIADMDGLQSYFIGRMQESLARYGKRLIGWDEILDGGLPPGATVMSWRGTEGGIAAARQGHDVVISPTHSLYLNYLQTDSAHEPAGSLSLNPMQSVYEFEPVPDELSLEQQRHILGLQGNLWNTASSTFAGTLHNTFPRLAAVAETAWSPRVRKDYADFLQRLPAQLQRYRLLDLAYAKTPFEVMPRARLETDGTARISLSAALDYPIHYTLDGTEPTAASPRYQSPFSATLPQRVRAALFHAGKPLAAAIDTRIDLPWLRRRESSAMRPCGDAPHLGWRLPGPARSGHTPRYNVHLFTPCWRWPDAPLQGIHKVRITAARLHYHVHLTPEEDAKRSFLPARSEHGEADIRLGNCEGPLIASTALPGIRPEDGLVSVEAGLDAGNTQNADLCIRFTGDTRPLMWVMDRVELLP